MSTHVLFWVPLPPPLAGPEIASELLVNACKEYLPDLIVRNASIRTENMRKGRLDAQGVIGFARAYARFLSGLKDAEVVYLGIAANKVGCIRDAVLLLTARALRRRSVIHLRGGRYDAYYDGAGTMMKRLLRWSWGSASRAVSETPGLSKSLAYAAPHVPISVIPNGLPSSMFPAKVNYDTSAPRILFVGHLLYSKGFYDLMRAFREIRRRWPNAILSCAGELPRPERSFADFLPASRQAHYLAEREVICDEIRRFVTSGEAGVEYAGIVSGETKRRLFMSADIFVLPSYSEGFSVALLEAMFHGLPIITTTAGGSPDIVHDHDNGLLIEPGDVESLIASLDALIARPDLREQMGKRNAREARERYELVDVAHQLSCVLQDV